MNANTMVVNRSIVFLKDDGGEYPKDIYVHAINNGK